MLAAIRAARPTEVPRPDVGGVAARFRVPDDCTAAFIAAAEAASATLVDGDRPGVKAFIASTYGADGRRVFATDDLDPAVADSPQAFADTDVFVCEAVLGVAENGAVWLPLSRLRYRSALFLATHVVVVLDRSSIVPHFHAAYDAMDAASDGFGVFVAGPSKTADIEQALVVGAHGAKSLTIVLV
jgi:L-lactate dehydrogenase complex protein LldG